MLSSYLDNHLAMLFTAAFFIWMVYVWEKYDPKP